MPDYFVKVHNPLADKESRLMEFDELILHTSRAVSRPPPPARAAADRRRDGWRAGRRVVARARGSSRRADKEKPTEGARDWASRGLPDRVSRGMAIAAPSVGLPLCSPAA